MQLQDDVMRRNRISGMAIHPHRTHRVLVCNEVMRRNGSLSEPLVLNRTEPDTMDDSGWCVGCNSPNHNHDDPNVLDFVHLLHVVQVFPTILAYLAMPVDTMLVISQAEVIVFPPGSEAGALDPIEEVEQ